MDTEFQQIEEGHRPISEENHGIEPILSPVDEGEKIEEPKSDTQLPLSTPENGLRKNEKPKRLSITVNFPCEEAEYLEQIIEARIKSGLTSDKGHFLRQCVDFAIHMEKLYGRHQAGFSFATPTDLPVTYLKGGFFKQK